MITPFSRLEKILLFLDTSATSACFVTAQYPVPDSADIPARAGSVCSTQWIGAAFRSAANSSWGTPARFTSGSVKSNAEGRMSVVMVLLVDEARLGIHNGGTG
jgi:hypothetical protein